MDLPVELVVLLDDAGNALGTADKATVHTADTPLHLAFSCHVFNDAGEVLVTRRALSKKTWAGVWTNSFCGHPGPGEAITEAIHRRAERELGLEITELHVALPDFRYRATDALGTVENEICPVYTARAASGVNPRADEVVEYTWVDPRALVAAAEMTPFAFSPWITMQLPALVSGGHLPA